MRIPILSALAACLLSLPAFADTQIGLAGPFTGPEASFGQQMRRGAEMAVADINASGGVLGQQLTLIQGDDQCDPKQAVSVAGDLVGKGVKAVIGPFCSGSAIPASDVYADENVIAITPASTNPALTEAGKKNIFRICGRDDQQGSTAAAFILSHFKGKRIAVVDDKQAYGQGLADVVRKTLNAGGVKEVLDDKINPGEKDYSSLVTKLKQAGIDVLYYGGLQNEAGLLVRQMRGQGMKTILIAGDGLATRDFWSITGDAGNGTLFTFPPDPATIPANAALVERFTKQGGAPEGYTLYTYAAFQAWAGAVKAAGTFDSSKVEAALRSTKLDTVLGSVSFDAKGDVQAPGYIVYEWKNGVYKPLEDQK
jgi:branched-chain amino acid transport system substrate-binding protein